MPSKRNCVYNSSTRRCTKSVRPNETSSRCFFNQMTDRCKRREQMPQGPSFSAVYKSLLRGGTRKAKPVKKYCALNSRTRRCRKTADVNERSSKCFLNARSDRCKRLPKDTDETVEREGFVLAKSAAKYLDRVFANKTDKQMEKMRSNLKKEPYSDWIDEFATHEALRRELYRSACDLAHHCARDDYHSDIIPLECVKQAVEGDFWLEKAANAKK